MQRRTRLIAAALAATTTLGLMPTAPAIAAVPPAQVLTFTSAGQLSTSEQFGPPGATPIVGDFNTHDGQDIVWYTPGAGGDAFWSANGDGSWSSSPLSVSGSYRPYVGQFTGSDKADDILWYSTTGASQLWDYDLDDEPTLIKTTLPAVTGTGTILVGDFTTDGATDVIRYRPGAQAEQWWDLNPVADGAAPSITARTFSVGGTFTPVLGGFATNGQDDGDDVIWYAAGSAADSLWDFGTDGSITKTPLTINGTFRPVVERWLPNAADDVLWYAPGAAADSLWDFRPDGSIQKQALTINGTYTPYICSCVDTGLNDREDIVWHGVGNAADAVWTLTGST
ncbi:MAG TPA: hypothetical protein VK507_17455, partial [Iamia sp.]|nr:hypothetical protein [Iamia sp.]